MNKTSEKDRLNELLKKYDRPGPRYTSYPMIPVWSNKFGNQQYIEALKNASGHPDQPSSLYLHIPFCRRRCWFCGCNTTTLKKSGTHSAYLDIVEKEISMVWEHLGERKLVTQFHWGGGTPTCLDDANTKKAFGIFTKHFEIKDGAEISIEIDPRITDHERVQLLKSLGFNRLSFGVQDFNPDIQTAIGRNQNEAETVELYEYCRKQDFTGINFDLIYGLPKQIPERFKETVNKVIALRPDRIALYSFAYLPESKPHQRLINPEDLPTPSQKLQLFLQGREMFLEAGYRLIGMDHFVLPDDELAIAQEKGQLRRNFMGYTVMAAKDWIGFGMSSISYIDQSFAQNLSSMAEYEKAIEEGNLAVYRGLKLSEDDILRQHLISELMCNFKIDVADLENRFNISFEDYFKDALSGMQAFIDDDLLEKEGKTYLLTDMGKIFIRNIAMEFDAYLKDSKIEVQFSRTV